MVPYWYYSSMSGFPIRCFTCGKVIANKYQDYQDLLEEGKTSHEALDFLLFGKECCRRMFTTHVDMEKYQLKYPTYPDGVQYVGREPPPRKKSSIKIYDSESDESDY